MLGRTNTGGGGGGGGLNFTVAGNPQPRNPEENTIWLDTVEKITSWIFSATEPETATQGMVWFPAGTSQSLIGFNALKKNGIMVYPKSAKQYVSGAWVDVTAKIWQSGEWANWARYIFQSGKGSIVPITHYLWNRASSSHTIDSIVHTAGSSGNDMSATSTTSPVDLRGYSMIYASAKYKSGYATGHAKCQCVGLSSGLPIFNEATYGFTRPNIALTDFTVNSIETVYSLPIPSGLDSAYIWIHGNGNVEVYDIWME